MFWGRAFWSAYWGPYWGAIGTGPAPPGTEQLKWRRRLWHQRTSG